MKLGTYGVKIFQTVKVRLQNLNNCSVVVSVACQNISVNSDAVVPFG